MSLDFDLTKRGQCVFSRNITHNLGDMAVAAGIYNALWHSEKIKAIRAKDIIPKLKRGLKDLKDRPDFYSKFDSPNGWGTYKNFVPFVEEVLRACEENPTAKIKVSV